MMAESPKTYCIVCAKEKPGIPIKEDRVIGTIRLIKKNVLKSEKRNRIVVCKDCYEDYKKYRKRYTRRQALYLALGVVFLIMLMLINPSVYAALTGLGMLALLYLLSLLNYMPELDIPAGKQGGK